MAFIEWTWCSWKGGYAMWRIDIRMCNLDLALIPLSCCVLRTPDVACTKWKCFVVSCPVAEWSATASRHQHQVEPVTTMDIIRRFLSTSYRLGSVVVCHFLCHFLVPDVAWQCRRPWGWRLVTKVSDRIESKRCEIRVWGRTTANREQPAGTRLSWAFNRPFRLPFPVLSYAGKGLFLH